MKRMARETTINFASAKVAATFARAVRGIGRDARVLTNGRSVRTNVPQPFRTRLATQALAVVRNTGQLDDEVEELKKEGWYHASPAPPTEASLDRAIAAELALRRSGNDLERARAEWQRVYAQGERARMPHSVDGLLVVADAWEEAGRPKDARRLRMEAMWNAGRPTPLGVSVPYGVYDTFTMRDLRGRYFEGDSTRRLPVFMDNDRYRNIAQPYAGPGGVFLASGYRNTSDNEFWETRVHSFEILGGRWIYRTINSFAPTIGGYHTAQWYAKELARGVTEMDVARAHGEARRRADAEKAGPPQRQSGTIGMSMMMRRDVGAHGRDQARTAVGRDASARRAKHKRTERS